MIASLLQNIGIFALTSSFSFLVLRHRSWPDIRHKSTRTLLSGSVFLTLLFTYLFIQKYSYETFRIPAFDGAIYLKRMWQYAHFNLVPDVYFGNPSHPLKDHFEPILFITGQLTRLSSNPLVGLGAEAILVALGFFPVLWLASESLGYFIPALVFATTYGLSIGILSAIIYGIHPGTWLTTFYAFALFFAHKGKWASYSICLFLALISKESAGAHLIGIGIFTGIWKKNTKIGVATSLMGLVFLWLILHFVMPSYNEGKMPPHLLNYRFLGDGVPEILITLVTQTKEVGTRMFGSLEKQTLLIFTFAITGFLSLLNPAFMLLSLPFWVERLIPKHPGGLRTLGYHYSAPLMSLLFIGTLITVSRLAKKSRHPQAATYSLVLYLCLCSTHILLNPMEKIGPIPKLFANPVLHSKEVERDLDEIAKRIPEEKSVLVTRPIAAHLPYHERIIVLGVGFWRLAAFALIPKIPEFTALDPEDDDKAALLAHYHLQNFINYSLVTENKRFLLYRKMFDIPHEKFHRKSIKLLNPTPLVVMGGSGLNEKLISKRPRFP